MGYHSGTCLEGNFYTKTTCFKTTLKNSPNKYVYPQSAMCLKKDVISYPKNISDVKEVKDKKVQVNEWLKSLWSREEKIYQQGCVELQHTKQVK